MTYLRTIAALLCVSAALHSANAADLTIKVTSPAEPGTVRVALYNDPATFLNKALAMEYATPNDGVATFKMTGLAPGRYAVSAFLDTNDNQKLDTNSFGVPQEPTGMSRGAKGKYGPPSFEDAAFAISDADLDIAIQLEEVTPTVDAAPSPNPPSASSAAALVTLSGVCRSFSLGHTTVRALHNIEFTIKQGEMVAIWGPSGSGKSSLMNIVGLIDRPDSGTLCFDGNDVSSFGDNRLSDYRSKRVGFVFQSFNLVPVLTVLENAMLPLQIQGVATSYARRKASELLEIVGLERHLRFRPDRLSGGQRQRTAIARALITDPKLVIADEPTASLDSENSQNVIGLMQSLNQKTGTSFLFATHDQRLLDHIPRTILLKDGMIEQDLHGETQ